MAARKKATAAGASKAPRKKAPAAAKKSAKTPSPRAKKAAKPRAAARSKPPPSAHAPLGAAPDHTLDAAAVSRAVHSWMAQPGKRASDYCCFPTTLLLQDAITLLSAQVMLPLFESAHTPISAREFTWLSLLVDRLQALGAETRDPVEHDEIPQRDVVEAANTVVATRGAVVRREMALGHCLAGVSGVPPLNPWVLFNESARMVRLARSNRVLLEADPHLVQRVDALEDALETLGEIVDALQGHVSDEAERAAEINAVKHLLMDTMVYVALWGREMAGGDSALERWFALEQVLGLENAPRRPPPLPADVAFTDDVAPPGDTTTALPLDTTSGAPAEAAPFHRAPEPTLEQHATEERRDDMITPWDDLGITSADP